METVLGRTRGCAEPRKESGGRKVVLGNSVQPSTWTHTSLLFYISASTLHRSGAASSALGTILRSSFTVLKSLIGSCILP